MVKTSEIFALFFIMLIDLCSAIISGDIQSYYICCVSLLLTNKDGTGKLQALVH